jgi:multidrug efflux pump subunit AcrB
MQQTIIGLFANHKVAANLIMIMMILSGLWAADRINTQLDPAIKVPIIRVSATWPGASAEDIETLIIAPIEQQLANMPDLQTLESSSRIGGGFVWAHFNFAADISKSLDDIESRLAQIRNFPADMEPLITGQLNDWEPVATLVVSSTGGLAELTPLVRQMEEQLYARGIAFIAFDGLPEEEIAIQVPSAALIALDTDLNSLADEVRQRSSDSPAGLVGRNQAEMQLRSLDQRRAADEFARLEVAVQADAGLARLGDFAIVERRAKVGQSRLTRDGNVAIEMELLRPTDSDALFAAELLDEWLGEVRPTLPQGVEVIKYQEAWNLIKEQLIVIFSNGFSGLILVLVTLFLFLSGRVGWWVMVGIPVSFLFATLLYYGLFGGSINILSLITFVMALGIVVDDAIVVSEDATTLFEQGMAPADAATLGARRMFLPVLTSSLTTLAAFVPLILAGGEMGAVIVTLPTVLLCVIVASLIECFLVLPGHLRHSFSRMHRGETSSFRSRFDAGFAQLRERYYKPVLERALAAPGTTLCAAIACVILAFSLIASGRVGLNMVTGVSLESVTANVQFAPQATPFQREQFMTGLESSLQHIDTESGGGNINGYVTKFASAMIDQERKTGNQFASIRAEYGWDDARSIAPQAFVDAWREATPRPPYVEELFLEVRGGENNGMPDLSLVLRGDSVPELKRASEELQDALLAYPGVSNVYDDLPYGRDQVIYSLTPAGKALGLSSASLGRQLRAAYNGERVQIFNLDDSELEVVVTLPDSERDNLSSLNRLPVRTPAGELVAMGQVAELSNRSGIDLINHTDGYLSVTVNASVDSEQNNAEQIIDHVSANALARIKSDYGLSSDLGGVSRETQELLETMRNGAILTAIFIYLILAWSFSSYLWPLAVMVAIPLGLTGAIVGHWAMNADIGAMSLLAFFSLTGIVVNDSIILISFFRRALAEGKSVRDAIHEASLSRFRAVILTSLTTIAGLGPLMFETFSLALFIVPIAITLVWGMAFATLLVLVVIPALIVMIENIKQATSIRLGLNPTAQGELP